MRLRLIQPAVAFYGGGRRPKKALFPPLGLAMIAALTPPDVDVSLTDENIEAIDFHESTDVVGISVLTITAPRAYEIADTFMARGVKVVLGGVHVSFLPDEAARHADAVVIGEAEKTWPRVVADLKADRLQPRYQQEGHPPLSDLPIPRRSLFRKGAYFFNNTLAATRGCPYSCSFCSVSAFFGRTYRCRPVADVLGELGALERGKLLFFIDDNIVGNPGFAKQLFRAMIPYHMKWLGQATVTIARDDELLELAAASGCVGLLVGFESTSQASLVALGKKANRADEYPNEIKKIHSKGIAIHGTFIVGLDEDDAGVFERTVRFAQTMRLESAGFAFPTPLPGTDLYESLDQERRLVTKEWSRYAREIVFEPRMMSRETLRTGHKWALQEFFRLSSILERIGLARRNLVMLWILNLVQRAHYGRLP